MRIKLNHSIEKRVLHAWLKHQDAVHEDIQAL